MNNALPDAISKVIGDERLLPVERDFIRTKILPVIAERQEFLVDALASLHVPLAFNLASHIEGSDICPSDIPERPDLSVSKGRP